MDIVAAFETSTRHGSVAVATSDGEVRSQPLERQRAHASDLLPALNQLIAELGCEPSDLRELYDGTGPGSFTGLRVASATALGLSRGGEVQCAGIPSFEAAVFELLAPGEEASFLFDARAGGFYCAHYARTNDDVVVRVPASVVSAAEITATLGDCAERSVLFTDAAGSAQAETHAIRPVRVVLDVVPKASAVLQLGRQRARAGHTLADTRPLYLRPFEVRRSARK